MAKGIREIKSRIKSTKNMRQITKAMEMVAASKLRRAQQAAEAARPYADKIKEVVGNIAAGSRGIKHPMLQARQVKRTGYLVITSDRGLAGGYNSNLLRMLMNTLNEKHRSRDEYALFVIGRKGRDYMKRRDLPIIEEVTGLSDSPRFQDIKSIAHASVKNFEEGVYDELYLVYNEFHNAITQTPVIKQLLPLANVAGQAGGSAASNAGESGGAANHAQYEYEPSAEGVLDVLLPQYAETLIFSALLEGKASEFGAKMTAMGSATKNATKMINNLTLQFNRARQAAITQEIAEIVAGANAQG